MRKMLAFVGVASVFALVGCAGEPVEEDVEAVGEGVLDEPVDEERDPSALVGPGDADLIAGWCDFQNTWPAGSTTFENDVLTLVNQKRAAGAVCGGVSKPPVAALTMDTKLRCAGRFHSKDMGDNNFFSHTGSNGSAFSTRINNAGYVWTAAAENIGAGYSTAAAAVNGWMASTGHCNNIMNGNYKHLGVGYYYKGTATYKHYWTTDFGKP